MDTRIEDASTYYDQTKSTLYIVFGTLWEQVVKKEEHQSTRDFQTAEVAFLEDGGDELREAAEDALARRKAKLAATERGIKACDLTINIVAGTILQIAKQAISIRHGTYRLDCQPEGRSISGSCVRDLIWHGRNQAMHYEDTKIQQPNVRDSGWVAEFEKLQMNQAGNFCLASPFESRAMEILKLLGWSRFDQYESDMHDLGINPRKPDHK